MRKGHIIGAGVALLVIGGIVWAFIAQHQWETECRNAGGTVTQHFDGYTTTFQNVYDAKGNLISVIPVQTPQYHYTCDNLPAGVTLDDH